MLDVRRNETDGHFQEEREQITTSGGAEADGFFRKKREQIGTIRKNKTESARQKEPETDQDKLRRDKADNNLARNDVKQNR